MDSSLCEISYNKVREKSFPGFNRAGAVMLQHLIKKTERNPLLYVPEVSYSKVHFTCFMHILSNES